MGFEASMSDIDTDKKLLLALGDGGLTPSTSEIAMAPYLDDWHIGDFALFGLRVVGRCTGHPVLGDQVINTSTPMHADLSAGWMKTRNTLYRMGTHKGDRS
jgi:hypothetical protein